MSEIIIREITNKDIWEEFIASHPESNFLQSWYWGEFHKGLGHAIQRTGFYQNEKLIGVCLSIVEPARRGRYLTVPAGPIIDWQNFFLVESFFAKIRSIATEQKCVFARIRPQLVEDEFSKKIFLNHGARPAPMHLHAELTNQLDITLDNSQILKNMRKATRYEINKAIKQGITIKTTTNEGEMKTFYDLQLETASRQKFVPFSYKFLDEQFKIFSESGNALLYTAEFENKLLAQAFIIFYGQEAVYHYGASTEEGRRYPGAYLIQWEAIKEAKRRGATRYNFWGVAPVNVSHHRFAGLSLFKRGFGGQDVCYLHARDIILDKKRYFFVNLVERLRKKMRHV